VIVNDEEAQIMLAGDASYLEATILNGTVDGINPNESIAKATLARIPQLCSWSTGRLVARYCSNTACAPGRKGTRLERFRSGVRAPLGARRKSRAACNAAV
jgi:hypothetical protein